MQYSNLKRIIFVALLVVIIIGNNSAIIASSRTNSLEEVLIDDICFLQKTNLKEEQFVKKYIERLFNVKRSYIKEEITDEFIQYIFYDFNDNKNINDFLNKITFQREWLKQRKSVILWDAVSIEFCDIIFDNNKVNVNLLEEYTYIQDDYNYGISSEGTRYSIEIQKNEEKWMITNIESHDLLDTIFIDEEFNLDETLNWMKNEEPVQSNDNIEKYKKVKEFEEKINSGEDFSILVDKTFTSYDRVRAKEYIDEYDGTKRNSNFFDYSSYGGDCQNFASQCLWYGFGGSNTKSAINNKLFPMIRNNGSRDWYQTSIKYDTPETWVWTGVDGFVAYIEVGGTAFGPAGVIYDGVAYAEVGDIIQIGNRDNNKFYHSYVVYSVQGATGSRTSSDIRISSHTTDLHNVLLTSRLSDKSILRTIHIVGHWSSVFDSDPLMDENN